MGRISSVALHEEDGAVVVGHHDHWPVGGSEHELLEAREISVGMGMGIGMGMDKRAHAAPGLPGGMWMIHGCMRA